MSAKQLTNYLISEYNVFNGAKYTSSEIFQNCLVFIADKKYIKYFNGTNQIYSWKSNGVSEESIENITKTCALYLTAFLVQSFLNGHSLINDNNSIHKKIISIYLSCILNQWPRELNTDFILGNCFFGSVKLTNNANPNK